MKPAKLSFFSNLALIVITVILLICSLSLAWLGSKMDSTTDITLTKVEGEVLGIKVSYDIKDVCDSGLKSYCKLSKASDSLITLTTFGMAAIVAAGVVIILNLFCKMSEKSPMIFRIVYIGTVIAGFVLFLVSFIEYNAVVNDINESDDLKYKSGWILYLISIIFSFLILLLGLSNLIFKDKD